MEAIKSWSENIIIVVIISIIIEMILPDGNSKKYVKVVSRFISFVCNNKSYIRNRYKLRDRRIYQFNNRKRNN